VGLHRSRIRKNSGFVPDQTRILANSATRNLSCDKALGGVVAVGALLTVNGGLAYRNTQQLNEDAVWVAHTHEVLSQTSNVILALVDAETYQKDFLGTGKAEFLQPYDAALARFDQHMTKLKDLTRDNPRQQHRLGELEKMTAEYHGGYGSIWSIGLHLPVVG
jgi:CHASE3 domain sensor protein